MLTPRSHTMLDERPARAQVSFGPAILEDTMRLRLLALMALLGLGTLGLTEAASAQGYPERAIRIIVPQPPGGGFDTVARVLAERLAPGLGQPVVVENRTGAGTTVGTEAAAKAPPDGYTLLRGAQAAYPDVFGGLDETES